MACPDVEVLDWASTVLDAEITILRGLRHGGSPWLLRTGDCEVILRVARGAGGGDRDRGRGDDLCGAGSRYHPPGHAHRRTGAEAAVAATRPDDGRPGLVHGDLWHGNTLWDDGTLTAVLDWDCAGVGPAGIDLGSLRCDAAWCHGIEAAEQGRPDLTGEVMIERRDAFLDAALTRLAAAR